MAEKLQGVNKKYPKVLCVRIACTNERRSVNTRAHTHTHTSRSSLRIGCTDLDIHCCMWSGKRGCKSVVVMSRDDSHF